METQAAILWGQNEDWKIETIELDPPKAGEVLVKLAASGMCHSDEHFRTGDLGGIYPIIGGHEGAGIIEEVGAGVTDLAPGDHVVFGFIPACGKCPSCARGHSNLCDVGATLMMGTQYDGTHRHHSMSGIDLIDRGVPRHVRPSHRRQPGVVREDPPPLPARQGLPDRLRRHHRMGLGRLHRRGQAGRRRGRHRHRRTRHLRHPGAKLAGAERIFAVDPVAFKRDEALKFGATHVAASIEEATPLVNEVTWGKNADKVIMTMGVGDGTPDRERHAADGQARPGRGDQHPSRWPRRLSTSP